MVIIMISIRRNMKPKTSIFLLWKINMDGVITIEEIGAL